MYDRNAEFMQPGGKRGQKSRLVTMPSGTRRPAARIRPAAKNTPAGPLLAVDGVVGVNLSGMGSGRGVDDGARIKAAVATELRGMA